MTTREAAELLGVSPSSIKRWADEGLLPCLKTAGSHRRFHRGALERFRTTQTSLLPDPTRGPGLDLELDDWIAALLAPVPPQSLVARLLEERGRRGSWRAVAELVGRVLVELGERWQLARLSILKEHLASERLARALAQVGEWLPVLADAPRALLLAAQNDHHTLGLALAELCLRELGVATLWAGRALPLDEVAPVVATRGVRIVAVSASAYSSDAGVMARQAEQLVALCEPAGVKLLLGGSGTWPDEPRYGVRLRGFDRLADVLG